MIKTDPARGADVQPEAGRNRIRIGCAGWSIRSSHAPLFGAGDNHLARYATRFDCVEINSSFYRSHQKTTYARWAASVPEDFRFSVKMPKAITHLARLRDTRQLIADFAAEVAGLESRLGGVLIQLPPSLAFDSTLAETFFSNVREQLSVPLAVEPRHSSWFMPDVDRLWHSFAIARVAADPPRFAAASTVGRHGDWRYWRWHGSPRIYWSAYSEIALRELADCLQTQARAGHEAWCILDNTTLGHATTDAICLRELCA